MTTYLLTKEELEELLRKEQQNTLDEISKGFLDPENQKKASFNDQVVFQAIGETIKNFPLPEPIIPVNKESVIDWETVEKDAKSNNGGKPLDYINWLKTNLPKYIK